MKKEFTAYSELTGEVLSWGTSDDLSHIATAGVIVYAGKAHGPGWIQNDNYCPLPPQPSTHHVFNYTTKQWEDPRTLADLKGQKWAELKAARDAFEFGSFTANGLEFDCDQISQQRIGQAAQGAMFAISVGAPFAQDWTLKDNSVVTFDAQQMIGVALAMGQHIGYAHTYSRQLRAAIEAASTVEEVEAINW